MKLFNAFTNKVLDLLSGLILWPASLYLAYRVHTDCKLTKEEEVLVESLQYEIDHSSYSIEIETLSLLFAGIVLMAWNVWLGGWIIIATVASNTLLQCVDSYTERHRPTYSGY